MLTLALTSLALALPPTLETETEGTIGNIPTTTLDAPIINGVDAVVDDYPSTGGMLLTVFLTFHWIPSSARAR